MTIPSQKLALPFRLTCVAALLLLCLGMTGCDTNGAGDGPGPREYVWSFELTKDYLDSTQPVIEKGRAYVPADDRLRAFDLESGKRLWSSSIGNGGWLSATKLLYDDGRLYLSHQRYVIAFSAKDGRRLWRTSIENFNSKDLSAMAQNETHLFYSGAGEVVRLKKSDGHVDLRIPLTQLLPEEVEQSGVMQTGDNMAVSDDGLLYVPTGYYM